MARPTASTFDFNALSEPEEANWQSAGVTVPIPAPIVAAVQRSLDQGTGEGADRVGKPLSFTVPTDNGAEGANVVTLRNFLRRAADEKSYGMDIRVEVVKEGKEAGKAAKVSFRTRARKFQGRGRKPASEAPAAAEGTPSE